ncbi:MAG: VOC family protein [Armatimonadetes bacterium]|nr:VOC family protein [Armatimonadota bacterium]
MATVRYLVHDVDLALPFYERLGFELKQRWGRVILILQKEDLELWLAGPEASAAQPMPDGTKPEPGGWNRFVALVDDLETKVQELSQAGVEIRSGIIHGPAGSQALVLDPSGNPVELFQPKG